LFKIKFMNNIVKNLLKIQKKIKLGNGLDKDINMGPMANIRGLEHIDSLVQDAKLRSKLINRRKKK